ncbi:capsular polysaccharide export system inner membrane protein KpsE [Vibrio astriarenae]|nr:capsular polysaccharide export system inner membrane protein KpsE [Vibrio sp. C7]
MENKNLAKKFEQFKQDVSKEEFNCQDFLKRRSEELMESDPELAKRILVRVNRLKKSENRLEVVESKLSPAPSHKSKALALIKRYPSLLFVVLPTLLFAFYQLFWAAPRFESQAQVIIQQPDSMTTMDFSRAARWLGSANLIK